MPGGRLYMQIATIGDANIYEAKVDPNGVISAPIGSVTIRTINLTGLPQIWQNLTGADVWVLANTIIPNVTLQNVDGPYATDAAAGVGGVNQDELYYDTDGAGRRALFIKI